MKTAYYCVLKIFLLLCTLVMGTAHGQTTFTTNGVGTTWESAANWTCGGCGLYPGQSATDDIVVINNSMSLTSSVIVGDITINNATLTMQGPYYLVAASIAINGTGTGAGDFTVQANASGSPYVEVVGNLTMVRNSTGAVTTRLRIGAGATYVTNTTFIVHGNLTYDFLDVGNETNADISVGRNTNGLNDDCDLLVEGNITLTVNAPTTGSGNVLALEVGHSSSVFANNIVAQLIEGASGGGSGCDIRIATGDNQGANITVRNDVSLIFNDVTAPNGASDIYLNAGRDETNAATSIIVYGNLNMTSNASSGTNNVHLRATGTSVMTIGNNLVFTASAASGAHNENRVQLHQSGVLDLNGTINNPQQGSFNFEPDGATDNGTIIFSGAVAQNFPERLTNNYKNVTIDNSSGTTMPVPTILATMTIEGLLTMTNGTITSTSSDLLVFADGATATVGNAASYIIGPVRKNCTASCSAITLPIGKGARWAPLGLSNITGASATTVFNAEYFPSTHANTTTDGTFDHISLMEYWTLTVSGTVPTTDLTLFWNDACYSVIEDLSTSPSQDLQMARYNTGTTSWNQLTATIAPGSEPCSTAPYSGSLTATVSGTYTAFTFAGMASGVNALPIVLGDFWTEPVGDAVKVAWLVNSEVNNDHFQLQRAHERDRTNFKTIARLEGRGSTDIQQKYSFIDTSPLAGVNFYRLVQVDLDGTQSVSKIIAHEVEGIKESLRIYPNPVTDEAVIHVLHRRNFDRDVPLKLFSATGLDVTACCKFYADDGGQLAIDVRELTKGIYFLRAGQGDAVKLTIQ